MQAAVTSIQVIVLLAGGVCKATRWANRVVQSHDIIHASMYTPSLLIITTGMDAIPLRLFPRGQRIAAFSFLVVLFSWLCAEILMGTVNRDSPKGNSQTRCQLRVHFAPMGAHPWRFFMIVVIDGYVELSGLDVLKKSYFLAAGLALHGGYRAWRCFVGGLGLHVA